MSRIVGPMGYLKSQLLCVLGLLAVSLPAAADRIVYKWIDRQGNIHYTRNLPPDYASFPHQKLNKDGLLISTIDPSKAAAEGEDAEAKPELTEADAILLASYYSEAAIQQAMETALNQIDGDIQLAQQSMQARRERLRQRVQRAANLQRARKPVSRDLRNNIIALQTDVRSARMEASRLIASRESTQASYEQDMERYRQLIADGAESS